MDDRLHGESNWRESARSHFAARHFTAQVDEKRGLYKFTCEVQPLATVTNFGSPKKCPFCGQRNPIGNGKFTAFEANKK